MHGNWQCSCGISTEKVFDIQYLSQDIGFMFCRFLFLMFFLAPQVFTVDSFCFILNVTPEPEVCTNLWYLKVNPVPYNHVFFLLFLCGCIQHVLPMTVLLDAFVSRQYF